MIKKQKSESKESELDTLFKNITDGKWYKFSCFIKKNGYGYVFDAISIIDTNKMILSGLIRNDDFDSWSEGTDKTLDGWEKPKPKSNCEQCVNKDMSCACGEISCPGFLPQPKPKVEELEGEDEKRSIGMHAEKINEIIRLVNKIGEENE